MLLAAHARGLASKWSTGETARSEHVKRFFGPTPDDGLVGFICLGYPADERRATPRAGHHKQATRLGWTDG